jgi:hypothetical protein
MNSGYPDNKSSFNSSKKYAGRNLNTLLSSDRRGPGVVPSSKSFVYSIIYILHINFYSWSVCILEYNQGRLMVSVRGSSSIGRTVSVRSCSAPIPLNTPSLRKQNNGQDYSIKLTAGASWGGKGGKEGETADSSGNFSGDGSKGEGTPVKATPWGIKPEAANNAVASVSSNTFSIGSGMGWGDEMEEEDNSRQMEADFPRLSESINKSADGEDHRSDNKFNHHNRDDDYNRSSSVRERSWTNRPSFFREEMHSERREAPRFHGHSEEVIPPRSYGENRFQPYNSTRVEPARPVILQSRSRAQSGQSDSSEKERVVEEAVPKIEIKEYMTKLAHEKAILKRKEEEQLEAERKAKALLKLKALEVSIVSW